MKRLTKKFKDDSGYKPIEHHNCCNVTLYDFNVDDYDLCVDKLGKLEDLEEELGCPLEVVFKALKDGIVLNNNILYKCKLSYIRKELIFVCYINTTAVTGVNVKDYQKTWWLKGEKDEIKKQHFHLEAEIEVDKDVNL